MTINEMIKEYASAKQIEKEAKKQAEKMKDMILAYASGANNFETDIYSVIIKNNIRCGIDTETLYKDFPDLKDVYGKTTEYKTITIAEKKMEKKTA